ADDTSTQGDEHIASGKSVVGQVIEEACYGVHGFAFFAAFEDIPVHVESCSGQSLPQVAALTAEKPVGSFIGHYTELLPGNYPGFFHQSRDAGQGAPF